MSYTLAPITFPLTGASVQVDRVSDFHSPNSKPKLDLRVTITDDNRQNHLVRYFSIDSASNSLLGCHSEDGAGTAADGIYVGGDVELVLRQGRLWLWRVLEVHEDRERYLLSMLDVAPSSRAALDGLVRWNAERRNFDQAIEWYARLTRVYPYEPDTGHVLGIALVESRRYRDGAEVFRRVLAMRRDWDALYGLGYALAWAGAKREAATYLKEAAELEPDDYRAFYSLGYVLRDTGQYAEAQAAWSRVLELMPVFPEVQNNLRAIQGLMKPAR